MYLHVFFDEKSNKIINYNKLLLIEEKVFFFGCVCVETHIF